jgi:hypothetical protein
LLPGSKPPEQKDISEASSLQISMLLQPMGSANKETQIRFKMHKDGEPSLGSNDHRPPLGHDSKRSDDRSGPNADEIGIA